MFLGSVLLAIRAILSLAYAQAIVTITTFETNTVNVYITHTKTLGGATTVITQPPIHTPVTATIFHTVTQVHIITRAEEKIVYITTTDIETVETTIIEMVTEEVGIECGNSIEMVILNTTEFSTVPGDGRGITFNAAPTLALKA